MATIEERMPRVAAGELHEGKRLMYPPISIVDVSLVARYHEGRIAKKGAASKDCRKQHATRIGIVPRQKYNMPPRAITGIVRCPCYLHIGLIEYHGKCDLTDDPQKC